MGLTFIVTDDADACEMSDRWVEVWESLPRRNFFGFYVLRDAEYGRLNDVATDADVKEFDWMVDDLAQFEYRGLHEIMVGEEDEIFKFISDYGSESLLKKYIKVINFEHDHIELDDIIRHVRDNLGKLSTKELDRLTADGRNSYTVKELAKFGDLDYDMVILGKLVIKALRSI